MVIEPTSQIDSATPSKVEKNVNPDIARDSNINNAGISEAGQTSEIAPAVVSNISATTLETSRAVNAPEQSAEQNRTADIVEARDKDQLNKPEKAPPNAAGSPQKSMLDTEI